MATIPIPIYRIERRMRGGTQALLVRDGAGNAYVAKCVGNPQGTRTLINEWIVGRLLKHLRVSTPGVQALRFERGIPGDELMEFRVGNRKVPIESGMHLGSVCPVDPDRKAIFDFLPRHLLQRIVNLPDMILAFVFDKWVNQTDTRQAIFIRERAGGQTGQFRAYLIDNGLSFGGSRWEFCDSALNGLYHDRAIYDREDFAEQCQSAINKISQLPEQSVLSIEKEIPAEWLSSGDRPEMAKLLELLCERRGKLNQAIERVLRQLDANGVLLPKGADARRLLGALLLAACVPGTTSVREEKGQHEVPPTLKATRPKAEESNLESDGGLRAVNLKAQLAFANGIGNFCVRVWQDNHPDFKTTKTAQSRLQFYRVYAQGENGSPESLVGQFALLLDK